MSKIFELLQRLDTPKRNIFELPGAAIVPETIPLEMIPADLEEETGAEEREDEELPRCLVTETGALGAVEESPATRLIPVASGKGGVGKTNMSVSLAIALAQSLRKRCPDGRVILIDCDFGLPNADILLQTKVTRTLEDFVSKRVGALSEAVVPTGIEGLSFLSGSAAPSLTLSNLNYQQRQKFVRNMKSLSADFIILDLGASVHHEVLDFFSMTNAGIIVTNPEPTALRDCYLFIRAVLQKKLRSDAKDWPDIIRYLDRLERGEVEVPSLPGLLNELQEKKMVAEMKALKAILEGFTPKIVVNRADNDGEGEEAARNLRNEARRELGINVSYLGPVPADPFVVRAVKESAAFLVRYPECEAARALRIIAERIETNTDFELERNYFSFGAYLRRIFTKRPNG